MIEKLDLGKKLMDDIYNVQQFDSRDLEDGRIGKITEKEKLVAAKQILMGIAILYVITIIAWIIRPNEGRKLVDIATISFPPIVTLILASYFREKD